jgi:Family of unknown function (DUF6535)
VDAPFTRSAPETGFESDPANIWKLYESEADKHDTELASTWKGETDAMLIFVRDPPLVPRISQAKIIDGTPKTGLFSAVVSAFIIETYKILLPDNAGATVALLTQLVAQSQSNSPSTLSAVRPTQSSFKASATAIRINILMFLSLFLSLTCALMSTLIQQWAREYLQYSQLNAPPQKRARVRAYLFHGLTKFQMQRIVESIPVLLHISVFFFFFAVSDYLRTVHSIVGLAARCSVIMLLSAYLVLSILPLVLSSSPYQTALTTPLRPCVVVLRFVLFGLPVLVLKGSPISFRPTPLQHNRSRDLLTVTERRAASLDHLALQWLLKDVDEDRMDKVVAGLPALIRSPFITDPTATMDSLVTDGILERVGEHLMTCMSSRELSQTASITRAIACAEVLDTIFSVLGQWANTPRCTKATNILIESSGVLCMSQDSAFPMRAACIRALTFSKLIGGPLSEQDAHSSQVPPRLFLLALRLKTWTRADSRKWRIQAELQRVERRVPFLSYSTWGDIIYDGHLINFLVLIRDVLSYAGLPSLDFTMVRETLETTIGTLGITQPTSSAFSRFEEVHADVREYFYGSNKQRAVPDNVSMMLVSPGIDIPDAPSVGNPSSAFTLRVPNETPSKRGTNVQERLSFSVAERYSQLLELMDKVAAGLRLVTVLNARSPQSANRSSTGELRLRHDQIYTKDPYGAFDVVDVLSSALPDFISAGPENARDTVEKILAEDGLLRSIDEHLKTTINSQAPQATRQHMSMTCLNVLEKIFTLFEGFSTVRWYKVGVDVILRSLNQIVLNQNMVGRPSAIHAGTLGLANYFIISQFRARAAPVKAASRDLPAVDNLEEQLFILKVHDWMFLGDESERRQRQARRQGDPDTDREASWPKYLENLLLNGPLQNFSIMAFSLVQHLEREEPVPEIAWTILRKLMDAPGLARTTDRARTTGRVALEYFEKARARAHKVVRKGGRESQKQLELLEMVNTVAEWLELSQLPMPDLGLQPQPIMEFRPRRRMDDAVHGVPLVEVLHPFL